MHRGPGRGGRVSVALALFQILFGASIARADETAASKPLPTTTLAAQTMKAIGENAPVYLRLFKEESELEVWQQRADGRYVNIKTFPICKWSGALGPKEKHGDLMAPEGFYSVDRDGLKPDSKYHLALNIGYPNALDRALGRNGDFIMVHGDCKSVGCFAMTDENIEEIYGFVREALDGGEARVQVHIFPFRMSRENSARHAGHPAEATWAPLQVAYDDFAASRVPPRIAACSKRYVVNPLAPIGGAAADACPKMIGKLLASVSPRLEKRLNAADQPLTAEGPKTRTAEDIARWSEHRSSLGLSSLISGDTASPTATVARPPRPSDADLGALKPLLDQ